MVLFAITVRFGRRCIPQRLRWASGSARSNTPGVVEMTAHPLREFRKVVQSLVEHAVDDLEVDIQLTVNDHVPETSHPTKAICEAGGKDVHLGKVVDGGGVIRDVSTGACGKVGRDVEHVLGTQLETPFDGPSFLTIGP